MLTRPYIRQLSHQTSWHVQLKENFIWAKAALMCSLIYTVYNTDIPKYKTSVLLCCCKPPYIHQEFTSWEIVKRHRLLHRKWLVELKGAHQQLSVPEGRLLNALASVGVGRPAVALHTELSSLMDIYREWRSCQLDLVRVCRVLRSST